MDLPWVQVEKIEDRPHTQPDSRTVSMASYRISCMGLPGLPGEPTSFSRGSYIAAWELSLAFSPNSLRRRPSGSIRALGGSVRVRSRPLGLAAPTLEQVTKHVTLLRWRPDPQAVQLPATLPHPLQPTPQRRQTQAPKLVRAEGVEQRG